MEIVIKAEDEEAKQLSDILSKLNTILDMIIEQYTSNKKSEDKSTIEPIVSVDDDYNVDYVCTYLNNILDNVYRTHSSAILRELESKLNGKPLSRQVIRDIIDHVKVLDDITETINKMKKLVSERKFKELIKALEDTLIKEVFINA